MPITNNIGAVLIIDDNPLVLHAVKILLEDYGLTSVSYSSAAEAIMFHKKSFL